MKNNICTTKEQSQKLIELGLDVNTADMVYCVELYKEGWKYSNEAYPIDGTLEGDDIPAWSLSALLELIPESIDDNTNNFSQLEMTKKSISYAFSDGMLRIGFLKEYLIDAAYEMVCWLLENKKIVK